MNEVAGLVEAVRFQEVLDGAVHIQEVLDGIRLVQETLLGAPYDQEHVLRLLFFASFVIIYIFVTAPLVSSECALNKGKMPWRLEYDLSPRLAHLVVAVGRRPESSVSVSGEKIDILFSSVKSSF